MIDDTEPTNTPGPIPLREPAPSIPLGRMPQGIVGLMPIPSGSTETADEKAERERANVYIAAFNQQILQVVGRLGSDDARYSAWRTVLLLALTAVTLLSGLALLFAVLVPQRNLATIVVSGAALVASLLTGLVTDPLKSLQRDALFQRWSDTIRMTFLARLSSPEPDIDRIGADACAQFETLTKGYAGVLSKTTPASGAPGQAATPGPDARGVGLTVGHDAGTRQGFVAQVHYDPTNRPTYEHRPGS